MNRLDYGSALDSIVEKLKEKHRLLKELQDIDTSFEGELDTLLM